MTAIDRENPLALEIQQEKAEAYFGACRKMVASLDALKGFDQATARSLPDLKRAPRRSVMVEEAAELVYFLVIQREAMNLRAIDDFFVDYDVPTDVQAQMGPRRQDR